MSKDNHIFIVILLLLAIFVKPQHLYGAESVAGERIAISGSSATVSQWFAKIEQEKNIVLSYDPSSIDLSQVVKVESGELTVEELLTQVLDGYEVQLKFMPPRKLVIHAQKVRQYYVSGTVSEGFSAEKLFGAIVAADNGKGGTVFARTDDNGFFRMYLPAGSYTFKISYMGFYPYSRELKIVSDRFLNVKLKPLLFEMEEVTVRPETNRDELSELTPSNQLSFNSNDLFSQIWILPGVTGVPTGNNFQVDGGSYDENQLLVDGVPVYHPGHINAMLPTMIGDAVKSVSFHRGFFPTRLEGRLSSVTEMRMKSGNKQEHIRTLTLDMPAASAVLEGPIVKNKLSYLVAGRRSWLDFFDNLLSEENRLNHSSYDYVAKLSYDITPVTSLEAFAYGSWDDYHWPTEENRNMSVLKWNSQIYQLRFNTQLGRVGNTTSVFYTSHENQANTALLGFDDDGYVSSRVQTLNAVSEFNLTVENVYNARWGVKYAYELFDIVSFGDDISVKKESIHQYSLFYDNHIRISRNLFTQVGVHFVGYLPKNHPSFYSIQPRFSLKYTVTDKDMLYWNFSRMEQFYHVIRLENVAMPTDFRMPSIGGFKPRSSEHMEMGWKHLFDNGQLEATAYYKTRRNVVALKPEIYLLDGNWTDYVMVGNGDSYGLKLYYFHDWEHWLLQSSYTYSRSREWFDEVKQLGKLPSLFDIPHQLNCAVSYKFDSHSMVSVGGQLHSGKVIETSDDFDLLPEEQFRKGREKLNYRVDVGYSFKKDFGKSLLLVRCGLYNLVGNPTEEEILSFYSIYLRRNCLPYFSVSFKF